MQQVQRSERQDLTIIAVEDDLDTLVETPQTQARIVESAPAVDRRRLIAWVGVVVLLLVEWALFRQFAYREILWAYPTGFDQLGYLGQSYETYEHMLGGGLAWGLQRGIALRAPQGTLIHLQASLLFLLFGPSRFSAIVLNFVYFALLQGVLVATLRWLSGRWSVAFLGLGLLLTTISRFFWGGSLMDFRLDMITFCLYGIFMCAVVRSGIFRSRRWSLVVGAVATLAVLFRFLTIVYMTGIFGLLLLFFGFRLWRQRRSAARPLVLRQIANLVLAGLVLGGVTLPVLWYNLVSIQGYYVVGHITSDEKYIRAREVGIVDLSSALLFYPTSVYTNHAGAGFVALSVLLLAITAGVGLFWRFRRNGVPAAEPGEVPPTGPMLDVPALGFFLAACLLVPQIVLTANISKSPIVGNILVPPLIGLVLLALLALLRAIRSRQPGAPLGATFAALATIAMGSGIYTELNYATTRGILHPHRASVQQVLELYDTIGQYSQSMGWSKPRFAIDRTYDFTHPLIIKPLVYERQGVLLSPNGVLGGGIFAVSEVEALEGLEQSDFAVLTVASEVDEQHSPDPFNSSMQAIQPALIGWADQHMVPVRQFHMFQREMRLYVRPNLLIYGNEADWITAGGVSLVGLSDVLRARPRIELRGKTSFNFLGKTPGMTAQMIVPGQAPKALAATLTPDGEEYLLTIRIDPQDIPTTPMTQINLAFDTYFVPAELGLNADTRKLVVMMPDEIRLLP